MISGYTNDLFHINDRFQYLSDYSIKNKTAVTITTDLSHLRACAMDE